MHALRIAVWNVQWRAPGSASGIEIRRILDSSGADVLCLTEGYPGLLPESGFPILASPDHGYGTTDGRRKVLRWSRWPWTEVDIVGSPALPTGRFARGQLQTPSGPLTVIGVCIPWSVPMSAPAAGTANAGRTMNSISPHWLISSPGSVRAGRCSSPGTTTRASPPRPYTGSHAPPAPGRDWRSPRLHPRPARRRRLAFHRSRRALPGCHSCLRVHLAHPRPFRPPAQRSLRHQRRSDAPPGRRPAIDCLSC